ncbi:hypothetical protein J6590_072776 [Homalodisca vitripennis]|nr:hypothetical protein J6590_072776 [Homalodisca vitripennis]
MTSGTANTKTPRTDGKRTKCYRTKRWTASFLRTLICPSGCGVWARARQCGPSVNSVWDCRHRTTLNQLQAPRYTRLTDLTPNVPYRVMQFKRCTTRLGETVMAILEDNEGQYRVFPPERYLHALTDDDITKITPKTLIACH